MIYNAKLLRVDLPAPNPPGAAIDVRCAMVALTTEQQRVNELNEWGATLIVYIPLRRVPSPRPVVDGQVLMRADDGDDDALFDVKQVIQRNGRVLGHIQVYVAPAE
jgi:hypothetical protein